MQQIEFHFKKLIGLMTNDDDIISLREHFIFQKMCSKITEQEFFIGQLCVQSFKFYKLPMNLH